MTTIRRRPRWSELRALVSAERPALGDAKRRVAGAPSIPDLRLMARRRAPRAVFDYVDGASGQELSLARAREAFARVEFDPRVLRDVSTVDPTTTMLGGPSAMPFALAPTGFTRLMGHEGELAVGAAAHARGIPYGLSTMGTTSIEDLAAALPDARRWFQLYVTLDREMTADLVRRADAAGYDALFLTVDTAVGGGRLRDARNGLTIPPALSARTLADMSLHPNWWFNLLTTEPLSFASLTHWNSTVSELVGTMFDASLDLADLTALRETWTRPLVVKGIQSVEDAVAVVDRGADAVVLSNHGGRQLDRSPTPLELLPATVQAIGGRAEIYIDGGVLSGADVVAAVAMGATGCLVGRAYLYGLMAGGSHGVARALDILGDEVTRTMALLGAPTLADLAGRARLLPA